MASDQGEVLKKPPLLLLQDGGADDGVQGWDLSAKALGGNVDPGAEHMFERNRQRVFRFNTNGRQVRPGRKWPIFFLERMR